MTDLITRDPNDTGEIPRLHGETRIRIDVGEATQNLGEYVMTTPSFDAIPRRVIEIDETVEIRIPQTIGLAGPQTPPPPLPKPPSKYDMAAAQPIAPWERIVDTERLSLLGSMAGIDGDLRPAVQPILRRSVPYVMPAHRRPWSGPRHAKPAPPWARLAVVAGVAMALGGGIGVAIILAVVR